MNPETGDDGTCMPTPGSPRYAFVLPPRAETYHILLPSITKQGHCASTFATDYQKNIYQ